MKITQSIDNGNQLLNLDLVPRDEHGNKVNPVTCSDITPDQKGVLELYNIVSVWIICNLPSGVVQKPPTSITISMISRCSSSVLSHISRLLYPIFVLFYIWYIAVWWRAVFQHKKVNNLRPHKGSDAARTNEPVHLFLGICQCVLLNQTPLEVYATLYNFDEDKMIRLTRA